LVSYLTLGSYLVLAGSLTIAYFSLTDLRMVWWGALSLSSVVAISSGTTEPARAAGGLVSAGRSSHDVGRR
jgi:hypothetical protein